MVALWCGIPAFLILIVWNLVEPSILEQVVINNVPAHIAASLDPASTSVLVDRVQAIASGFGVSDTPAAYEVAAAEQLAKISNHWFIRQTCGCYLCGLIWSGVGKETCFTTIPRT